MSWLDFEGEIEEGYGAGDVKLDSKSTFQTVSHNPKKWVFYVNSMVNMHGPKYTLIHSNLMADTVTMLRLCLRRKGFQSWYDL